jgi:hypothetical protein
LPGSRLHKNKKLALLNKLCYNFYVKIKYAKVWQGFCPPMEAHLYGEEKIECEPQRYF